MSIQIEQLYEAIDRIARTRDGELLYLFFQRIAMEVVADEAGDGALRASQGRRSFALELMARMAKGIDERTGNTSTHAGNSERPIVFRSVAVGRSRLTARQRIAAGDPELAAIPGTDKA